MSGIACALGMRMGHIRDSLNRCINFCFVASRGYIVTPCQRERSRRSYLPLIAGKYVPRCQVDGTYDEVQCDLIIGQCWCVDRDGREIKGTRSEGVIRCPTEGILAV